MKNEVENIFNLPSALTTDEEVFETIVSSKNILIERIISTGRKTADGTWYDQKKDEWVVLLQGEAELSFENGRKINMRSGDYIFLPAHEKHRVEKTSSAAPCIWLAVHGVMNDL